MHCVGMLVFSPISVTPLIGMAGHDISQIEIENHEMAYSTETIERLSAAARQLIQSNGDSAANALLAEDSLPDFARR